jgi:HlyD family secretion protein
MMAQRSGTGAPGGQTGAPPAGSTAAQAQPSGAAEGQRGQTQVFQMGARFAGGQGGARRQQPSRVWVQDKDGKLRMVFIRPGLTDNSYTEIIKSDLKEGDTVIIGLEGAGSAANRLQQMGGPGRGPGMMFIGR